MEEDYNKNKEFNKIVKHSVYTQYIRSVDGIVNNMLTSVHFKLLTGRDEVGLRKGTAVL
jgi:hypothetical protein